MDFDQTREDSFGGVIQAVIANDLRKLQDLSRKGKSMRICDNRGLTPLHHAVRLGPIDCIEWLICQDEVDINSLKTFTGDTALHTVCRQSAMDPFKRLQVCKLLLNLTDIDVSPINLKGMTPIHYASRSKDKDVLKLLLDRDKNNQSLYLICQDQGNPLHCLLENPNNVESGDDDLLECIDLLVDKYPDMIHQRDERQLLPFQVAIISKMEQPALKLIEMATVAEVTTEKAGNYTSLSIAAGRGLYKVVQELLDRGADPNFLDGEDNDIVALALACNNNNPMTVRCLAERTRLARIKKTYFAGANPFEICIHNFALKNLEVLYDTLPSEEFLIEETNGFIETPMGYFLRTLHQNVETIEFVQKMLEKYCNLHTNQQNQEVVGNIKNQTNGSLEPLLCLGLNQNFNQHCQKLVLLLRNKGASLFNQATKERDTGILVSKSLPEGLIFFLKEGIIHPEDFPQFHPIDQDTYYTYTITLNNVFAQYVNFMTIGTTITSKHMKILMKKYTKHKELQHLTQKLYEFQNTPLSLSFLARKALRMKLQSEGCYDFKNNSVVLELPKPLRDYIFFDDLDVKEMCKLYRQSDCGCQTIRYKSNCPRNS